jgi:hypothetical protein
MGASDMSRRLQVAVSFVLLVSAAMGAGQAATASTKSPATYETNASDDQVYGGSEPWVAVNPLNSANVVVTYNASALVYGHADAIAPSDLALDGHGRCGFATSFDRGKTWLRGVLPLTDPVHNTCGDNDVTVGSDGTFYATGLLLVAPCLCLVEIRVTTSHDGGLTWDPYTIAFGPTQTLSNFEAGRIEQVSDTRNPDREWFAVDSSTNKVYLGTIYSDDPDPDVTTRGRQWVNVTADGAETWGTPHPLDDATSAPRSSGGMIDAANGTLAASYTARAFPDASQPCPCGVFETSQDDGATWTRRVTPFLGGYVAADQSSPGRFAVMNTTATELQIHVTEDYGKTWTAAAPLAMPAGDAPVKPWFTFSPHSHALGVMWRQKHADGTFDIWVAISPKRGGAFTRTKVNTNPSPGTGVGGGGLLDDTSALALDDVYAHVSWGDGRSGVTDAWYGFVRYSR